MKPCFLRLRLSVVAAIPVILAASAAHLPAQSTPAPAPSNAAPPAPLPVSNPDVVARFGNTELRTAEMRALLNGLDPKQLQQISRDPELLKKAVTNLIIQRLVLSEALSKKWDQQPAVVEELKRVRENAVIQSFLASVSRPPADFPSAAELQRVYDANKSTMLVPRQFLMAQIFISSPPNADAASAGIARAKFEAVKKSLQQSTTDFAAIARTESDDKQSAAQGGQIGWVTENQIQPEIRSQLPALSKGFTSQPMRLNDGWHFLKVIDVKEAYTPTLDQVRDQLTAQVRAAKSQAMTQAYIAELLKQNPVTVNPPALANLIKKE